MEKKEVYWGKEKTQEKKYWNRKERLSVFFFLCFLLGIFIANMVESQTFHGFLSWKSDVSEVFYGQNMYRTELFYYIAVKRMPIILILFLILIFTKFGKVAGVIFFSWQGFSAGFLMAVSVIVYGIKGILWVLASVFPHYLIYIPVYVIYLRLSDIFADEMREKNKSYKRNIREIAKIFSVCFLLISIYILGIFLESYINPYILEFF